MTHTPNCTIEPPGRVLLYEYGYSVCPGCSVSDKANIQRQVNAETHADGNPQIAWQIVSDTFENTWFGQ